MILAQFDFPATFWLNYFYQVLATGLCNFLSPVTWKRRLQSDPSVTNDDIEAEQLNNYGSTDENDAYNAGSWPEMLPPGKIIHIYFRSRDQISMTFRDPQEFNEILVSTKMINDHSPSSYQKMIAKAKERFIHNSNQELNPSVWSVRNMGISKVIFIYWYDIAVLRNKELSLT